MNIFSKGSSENRILKDESLLLPDFVPQELPEREKEIKELVFCLSPAAENRQPEHALLYGPPGTGKTSCARYVLKQLSEYSQRPLPIYINCWEKQTRFSIFSYLALQLGEAMPRRGLAADELFSRIVEIAKKEGKILIVVLDEVDRLEAQSEGVQVLYDLCRAGEVHSLRTGVVAITNDEEFHTRLDSRVRSSFVQHTQKFSSYSSVQLKQILSRRAKPAFFPDVLDQEVIPLCSAIALKKGGDARVGLSLLLSAAKAAERQNSQKVLIKHIRQVQGQSVEASAVKAQRKLDDLDELDRMIIQNVKKAGKKGIESGKLYSLLSKFSKQRALRKRVDRLEKTGLLAADEIQLKKGRSRMIRLKE